MFKPWLSVRGNVAFVADDADMFCDFETDTCPLLKAYTQNYVGQILEAGLEALGIVDHTSGDGESMNYKRMLKTGMNLWFIIIKMNFK